jgi:hypothetical protein
VRVFLSYHTPDEPAAQALKHAIEARGSGIEVFFAPYNLKLGAFWLPVLREAITEANAFLIILGKQLGAWQKLEYYEAIDRKAKESRENRNFPVVPVKLSDRAPNLPFLSQFHWIESAEPTSTEPLSKILYDQPGALPDALRYELEEARRILLAGARVELLALVDIEEDAARRLEPHLLEARLVGIEQLGECAAAPRCPDRRGRPRVIMVLLFIAGSVAFRPLTERYTELMQTDPEAAQKLFQAPEWFWNMAIFGASLTATLLMILIFIGFVLKWLLWAILRLIGERSRKKTA